MKLNVSPVVAVLLMLVAIQSANGLKCYNCVDCKDGDKTEMNCDASLDRCLTVKKGGQTAKGCGIDSVCKVDCHSCKTDLCNAGKTFGPIALLIVVAVFASCGVMIG